MLNKRRSFSSLYLILIGEIVASLIGIQAIKLDNDIAERNIFSVKHLNIPKSISRVLSHNNWTDNQNCLTELNEIQNGLETDQRWATRGKLAQIDNILNLKNHKPFVFAQSWIRGVTFHLEF